MSGKATNNPYHYKMVVDSALEKDTAVPMNPEEYANHTNGVPHNHNHNQDNNLDNILIISALSVCRLERSVLKLRSNENCKRKDFSLRPSMMHTIGLV